METFSFKQSKSDYDAAKYVNGTLLIDGEEVGTIKGHLVYRGAKLKYENFHSACDQFSQECVDIGSLLFDSKGNLRQTKVGEQGRAILSGIGIGSMLHIEKIEIHKKFRGRELSIRFLKACLDHFDGKFGLCAIQPFPFEPEEGKDFSDGIRKLS
jgi:hypothetical protein